LLGTTIAGVVTTGVLAAKAGYKARGIIDEERASRIDDVVDGRLFDTFLDRRAAIEAVPDLTVQEKIKLTWLCYAVPGVTGASTIAAAVGIHTIHTKRANTMAALYAVTSTKLDDYTERAEELLGPKKTQQVRDEVAQKAVDRNPPENNEVVITGHGTELCYDEISGRYFMSSVAKLEDANNEVNRRLIDDGDCSLNDYYDFVGLPPIPWGLQYGWSGPAKVRMSFGSTTSPDGRAAISAWFQETPKDNYSCP
jgi:hypothetical protein